MARPDYIICLECESEVEDFSWRDGEIRRVSCEVCGNADPGAFSLPENFEDTFDDEDDEVIEDEELDEEEEGIEEDDEEEEE